MLTAAGSALVVGAAPNTTMSKTVDVKVLRAFLMKGEPQKVGAILKGVDRVLAAELKSANKVEIMPAPAAEPPAKVADPAKAGAGKPTEK